MVEVIGQVDTMSLSLFIAYLRRWLGLGNYSVCLTACRCDQIVLDATERFDDDFIIWKT